MSGFCLTTYILTVCLKIKYQDQKVATICNSKQYFSLALKPVLSKHIFIHCFGKISGVQHINDFLHSRHNKTQDNIKMATNQSNAWILHVLNLVYNLKNVPSVCNQQSIKLLIRATVFQLTNIKNPPNLSKQPVGLPQKQ